MIEIIKYLFDATLQDAILLIFSEISHQNYFKTLKYLLCWDMYIVSSYCS